MFPIYCAECGEEIAHTKSEELAKTTKDQIFCVECKEEAEKAAAAVAEEIEDEEEKEEEDEEEEEEVANETAE